MWTVKFANDFSVNRERTFGDARVGLANSC